MAFGFPIVLDLAGVPVLVVGGGEIATRKAAQLVGAGARVTVVAPDVRAELVALAGEVRRRRYVAGDIAGHRLVLTATDDPVVNATVAADATASGIWVNSADDPANCSFILPAVARRGPVVVAVGTGGASPALAQHLRSRIADEILTERVAAAAEELALERAEIRASGVSTESVDWSPRLRRALGEPL